MEIIECEFSIKILVFFLGMIIFKKKKRIIFIILRIFFKVIESIRIIGIIFKIYYCIGFFSRCNKIRK